MKHMIIETRNLTRVYKSGDGTELIAINHLNFSVEDGEFVAITGRSGSGKSTLLYQIGLLDEPSFSDVILGGINASQLTVGERTQMRLRTLGYVFQDYALLPSLTALENVMVPLLLQGLGTSAAAKKAARALERLTLADRMHNLPSQLSGGQQQRVSIARAIGHDPKIIFADEPTANLDNETSRVVLKAFLELHQEGQTVVMVTHEPEFALLADRTVTLLDGSVIHDGANTKKESARAALLT